MTVAEVFENISAGGILSALVIILSLIEITPIKVSPLKWIGKRLNKETIEKVDKFEKKLDEHIAQSYRDKIMGFQEDLLRSGLSNRTQETWAEIINACEAYEKYIKDYDIPNGLCEQAINFIKESYHTCLINRDFALLP